MATQAQDTIFQEPFDYPALFPPAGWTNIKVAGTGAPGTWKRVLTGGSPIQEPHSDPAQAKFNSYYYPAGTAADLSTPVLDFTTTGTYLVSFYMYRDPGAGADKVEVFINTTQASAGGTLIGTVNRNQSATPVETAEGWYNYTFTVPGTYNTATNYITFKATSDYGFNIFMDDVVVLRDTLVVPPTCTAVKYPADNAVDICTNLTLTWDVVPYATGYKLTLGDNAPNYNNIASNIDLGNTLSYTVLLDTATNYKWKLRPYNTYGAAAGCIFDAFTTASGPCYCAAGFIQSSCTSLDFIDDFYTTGAVANISNMNTGCSDDSSGYFYFDTYSVTATKGYSFNVFMQSGNEYEQGYTVWVDWNHDGDFDDLEEHVFSSSSPTTALVTGTINVPEDAQEGTTRMRVRAFYNLIPPVNMSCGIWNEGETEDYNINVVGCSPITYYYDGDNDGYGVADSTTTSCSGAPAGFSDNTLDCDDTNNAIHPTALELCNGIDENCNLIIDEDAAVAIITPSGASTVCKGTSLILNVNTGAGYTYQWKRNAANIAGATNATYSVTKSGNYSVVVNVPGGCSATSATTTCTVNPKPAANISNPDGLNLCGIPSLNLVANGGVGFTYIWYKNGVTIPGATDQTLVVTEVGDYRVKVINAAGCSRTSAIKTVINVCRTSGEESPATLQLFPNPATETITLNWNAALLPGALNLHVFDIAGREMHAIALDADRNTGVISLPVHTYAAGMYILVLASETTVVQQQFSIVK